MRPSAARLLWLAALVASTADAWRMMAGPGNINKSSGYSCRRGSGMRMQMAPTAVAAASASRAFEGDAVGFLDPREATRPSLEVRVNLKVSLGRTHIRTHVHRCVHPAPDPTPPTKQTHTHKQAAEARFLAHLQQCPFIAVLRGVAAADVAPTMAALLAEGVGLASVPAEAPAGLAALREVGETGGEGMMVGAATVVSVEQVEAAAAVGASFVSCPHVDPEIIERCVCVAGLKGGEGWGRWCLGGVMGNQDK